MSDYLERDMMDRLQGLLEDMPVVVVSGPRQSGKSTMLEHEPALRGRRYMTLDDYPVLSTAQSDPEGLWRQDQYVTIDEVQRHAGLLVPIKAAVDRGRKHGRFLLSGSADLSLLANVTETLAGRAVYITLLPMTRREQHGNTSKPAALVDFIHHGEWPTAAPVQIDERDILVGGFPPVCLSRKNITETWFAGYTQTYIERDVRQIAEITNLVAFRTFVELAALRTAQILNISQLARDASLPATTAARFQHLLETSFLVRRLPPYLKNPSARLIKSPKLYCIDSGLAAYLTGVRSFKATTNEPLRGALFETWMVQNLTAILGAKLPDATLSYWHEQGRYEVDLVIEWRRKVWALEFKTGTRWGESDLRSLRAFLERSPQCEAAILAYNGKQVAKLGPKLWAVPCGMLVA